MATAGIFAVVVDDANQLVLGEAAVDGEFVPDLGWEDLAWHF